MSDFQWIGGVCCYLGNDLLLVLLFDEFQFVFFQYNVLFFFIYVFFKGNKQFVCSNKRFIIVFSVVYMSVYGYFIVGMYCVQFLINILFFCIQVYDFEIVQVLVDFFFDERLVFGCFFFSGVQFYQGFIFFEGEFIFIIVDFKFVYVFCFWGFGN